MNKVDQVNIESLSKNELQNFFSYSDIRNMDRDQLISLFYAYIKKEEYLNKRYETITNKIKQNNQIRSDKLEKVDKEFQSFYFKNLSINEYEAKEKMKKAKKFKQKISNIFLNEGMIKFRYLLAIIYIPIFIFFAVMYLSYTGEHLPGDEGFFEVVIFLFLWVFGATLLAYFPLKLIVKLLLKFINPVKRLVNKCCSAIVIKAAQSKDISVAKANGITKDNIEQVFKLDERKQMINNSFNELEEKISSWERNKSINIKNELTTIGHEIPMKNKSLDHMIYIYEQLYVGSNDTWKESINDLKLQLRHEDISNELKNISTNIMKTNNMLVKMNSDLQHNFNNINTMISQGIDHLDSKMDDLADTVRLEAEYIFY